MSGTILTQETEAGKPLECENPRNVSRGSFSQAGQVYERGDSPKSFHQVGLHWYRASFLSDQMDELCWELILAFGESKELSYGRHFYNSQVQFDNGVAILFHSDPENAPKSVRKTICVDIPGKALDEFSTEMQFLLLKRLSVFNPSISRLDIYFDDYKRIISPYEIYDTVYSVDNDRLEKKKDFCFFHNISPSFPSGKRPDGKIGLKGEMVSFGNRGSRGCGKYFRVYDKWLESGGEQNCIRFELELSSEKAKWAYRYLLGCKGDISVFIKRISATIAGCVDFKKKYETGEKNLSRIPRYEWWEQLLEDMAEPEQIPGRKITTGVEKSARWLNDQTVGSMQKVCKAIGIEEFIPLLVEVVCRESKLKPEHYKEIEKFQKAVKKNPRVMTRLRDYFTG